MLQLTHTSPEELRDMSDSNPATGLRFVVVIPDQITRLAVKRHLNSAGSRVIGDASELRSGLRLIRGLQPDFVVLGLGDDADATLEVVRTIREEQPGTGIIVVSPESSPDLILRCVRAGALEFLPLPLDFEELSQAVERLHKVMVHMPRASRRGRVLAVCPSKGGVGASSVATNLALAIAGQPEKHVALVDFNAQGADLGFMLDVKPTPSFARGAGGAEINQDLLTTLCSRHRSGLKLITVFDRPEESKLVTREQVPELFGVLGTMFDYVIVDVGRTIGERTVELLDLANEILIVSAMDGATLRNTRRLLDRMKRLELPEERLRLVVNRHQEDGPISNEELEERAGLPVFWNLPNEFRPMSAAIDAGNPVLLDSPGSRLARSYRALGSSLTEIHTGIDTQKALEEQARASARPSSA